MKRNKIVSILEYSARNKMLVGILAVSLIGAGGVFLSSQANISNNTIGINKTVLAETLNNNGNKACVINGNDSLVLYTSASNSNIKAYISVGEMLTINNYSNGYYNVTVQETGATGYIASSNMQKIVSGVGYDLTSLSGSAYVTNVSTVVNLRENATMNSTSLAKLKNDTSVTLLGKQGDWYKVSDNGTTGYIYGEYIAIANTSSGTTSNSSSSATNSSNTSKTTGTASSNSSSSTKATSSNSGTSTTGTTSSTGSSSSSNSSNNTTSPNALREQNNNKFGDYLGNWEVSKNVGHSIEGMTENAESLIGTKLQITNSTYSFDGVTINNPYYYVKSVSARDLFGQDGSIGVLQNQQTLGILIVSSKPLTASEVQNMPVNDSNPTIILYNSNIYVFGGGENHAQIDGTTKSTSSTSGTISNTGSSSSSNTSQIKWVLGNGQFGSLNTVVIENTTGKAIPNNTLATYMRDWILNAQYNYSGFADCDGTMWQSQWLDTISNSQLVSYFESANGNEALSQNITANELNKATTALTYTLNKENYMPFTMKQATTYIKEMLAQSYPNETITKVVQVGDGYNVYTTPFNTKNSSPFWIVSGVTGYARG